MERRILKFEIEQRRITAEEEEGLRQRRESKSSKKNEDVVMFLKELKAMDVDITRLLCGDENKNDNNVNIVDASRNRAILRELMRMSPILGSLLVGSKTIIAENDDDDKFKEEYAKV